MKWPLKADHFCLFWEHCCTTHPTITRDTFPFAKPSSANGRRRAGKKPLQSNLLEVSQPSWGLPGWGHTTGAPSAGHSFLIQKASSSFRQGVRTSQPAAFRKRCASRASLRVTEWGSEGSKYNQEFSHPAVVMDMASWCVSTSVSVKAWGSWNKRKQIPSEFLLSKQRAVQWANAFPGKYPTPVLQSHQTFIPALRKCSSRKKCLPLHSTSSCSLLFQFFSSHSHTLPLIITFQVWL